MNVRLLTFLAGSVLFAADEQRLALVLKSQTDFERVFLPPAPQLHDTNACIQTQASMIPIATPEELPIFRFRKAYCTLAQASITGEAASYSQAAAEFDKSIEAWPGRNASFGKKRPPEPLPAALPVLASIARLKAGNGDGKEIAPAVTAHACPESVIPAARCDAILQTGREWLGWMALRHEDIDAAALGFPPASPWANWVAGKQAFRGRNYKEAAAAYRRAVDGWDAQARASEPPLLQRLSPPADLSDAYAELGGAQFLAGDSAGAIATLNQAIRQDSTNARALFLRARAKETAGQTAAAIADYSLAARNALAKSEDQSGEAHLYRGISLYRRKEYAAAEDEFANALNVGILGAARGDAAAWRRLAAVASGSCGEARKDLEDSLPAASPYFPRDEARKAMAACATATTAAQSMRVK